MRFDGWALGVTIAERSGQFILANDTYCEITGYSEWALLSVNYQ